MNTKQVLLNVLKSQLDIKEQTYVTFNESITQPAYKQLEDEIKQYLSVFANIEGWEFSMSENKLTFRNDNNGYHYSSSIHFELNNRWSNEPSKQYVNLEWYSGEFDLKERQNKINYIDLVHSFAHNLHYVESKWLSDWYVTYKNIADKDSEMKKEWTNLRDALHNLEIEIKDDFANEMKQSGFEIKKFKQHYRLDWDYDAEHKRVYKMDITDQTLKLQFGRSQYDTIWVNGFKTLNKKGNKYNIEVYRNGVADKTYAILEKKFDSFVNDVVNWETIGADKRKNEAEERLERN